jgi:hypothetical protein
MNDIQYWYSTESMEYHRYIIWFYNKMSLDISIKTKTPEHIILDGLLQTITT